MDLREWGYFEFFSSHHRRAATVAQIPSTKPNGHAPCKKP